MQSTFVVEQVESALPALWLTRAAGCRGPRGGFLAALLAAAGLDVGPDAGRLPGTDVEGAQRADRPPGSAWEIPIHPRPDCDCTGGQTPSPGSPGPNETAAPAVGGPPSGEAPADGGTPAEAQPSAPVHPEAVWAPGETAAAGPVFAADPAPIMKPPAEKAHGEQVPSAGGTRLQTGSGMISWLQNPEPEMGNGRPDAGVWRMVAVAEGGGEPELPAAQSRVGPGTAFRVPPGMQLRPPGAVVPNVRPAPGETGTVARPEPEAGAVPETTPAARILSAGPRPLFVPAVGQVSPPVSAPVAGQAFPPASAPVTQPPLQGAPERHAPVMTPPAADAAHRQPEAAVAVVRVSVVPPDAEAGIRDAADGAPKEERTVLLKADTVVGERKPEAAPGPEFRSAASRTPPPGAPVNRRHPGGDVAGLDMVRVAVVRGEVFAKDRPVSGSGPERFVTTADGNRQEVGPLASAVRPPSGETPVTAVRNTAQPAAVPEKTPAAGAAERQVVGLSENGAAATDPPPAPVRAGVPLEPPAVARQLAEVVVLQVRRLHAEPGRSIRVQLTLEPPQLGRVTLKLTFGRQGLEAEFFAPDRTVKALIEQALPQLREALVRQEIPLGNTAVFVGQEQAQEQTARFFRGWGQDPPLAEEPFPGAPDEENRAGESPLGVDCLV